MSDVQEILSAIGKSSDRVYNPSDDTFLMIEALSTISLHDKEALDLGTGSGILGLLCAQKGAHVTVADIEDTVLEDVKVAAHRLNLTIHAVKSDLFSGMTTAKFDIILFNPPYLPSGKIEDPAVDGGNCGTRFIDQFLGELSLHLKDDGFALLLVSSLNHPSTIVDRYRELSFTVAASRKLFFEELQVLLCRLRDLST